MTCTNEQIPGSTRLQISVEMLCGVGEKHGEVSESVCVWYSALQPNYFGYKHFTE